ncbi:hypothetical protein BV22DRAFT_1026074 [Leucogyrophana mollusca]|uniref:Uncharacterized protein n=1 Tax=Leucogyrophana mollusca TaxID=85980 RepID=A0ACB8AYE3_9AGAM|nr:hypothetical protein BV22DRAFT_1026074 [Leucogyrophana mollusca]
MYSRAINRLGSFAGPLLSGMHGILGVHVTLIVGRPEPRKGGAINVLSMHEGTDKSVQPLNWQQRDKKKYKAVVALFQEYLSSCYSPEDRAHYKLPDLGDAQHIISSAPDLNANANDQSDEDAPSADPRPSRKSKAKHNAAATRTAKAKAKGKGKRKADTDTKSDGSFVDSESESGTESEADTDSESSKDEAPAPLPPTSAGSVVAGPWHHPSTTRKRHPPEKTICRATTLALSIGSPAGTTTPLGPVPDTPASPLHAGTHPGPAPRAPASTLHASTHPGPALDAPDSPLHASTPSGPVPDVPASEVSPPALPLPCPDWFKKAYDYLLEPSLPTQYTSLLIQYIALEASTDFEPTGSPFSATHRPKEVAWWIARKRPSQPPALDLAVFPRGFWDWWKSLQPEWRNIHIPTQSNTRKSREDHGDWTALDKRGQNGFLSVMACLKWWGTADKCKGCTDARWLIAVEDVQWVMERVIQNRADTNSRHVHSISPSKHLQYSSCVS